ncbi:hypothetical protein [Xylanimonas protaetiae]|uniref:Uncharacterized protein n=1 Tax=Xylanimonas protaetiae TaxID=2509457 RepID=A0A4V0YFW8_9MICO|nr:hypothetical protein [Xylanimonas protaetiae]QAY69161.1 hypothetical protein ET471_03150 [Xylanimonas protaetiae]
MSEQHDRSTADKIADAAGNVAESVRKAIEEGLEAIKPTWEEKVKPAWEEKVVPAWEDKVAPAIASGAEKVAGWGEDVRDAADKKSSELSAGDKPSDKILGGALGVGAAAAALGSSAAKWVSKEAAQIGHDDDAETAPLDTETPPAHHAEHPADPDARTEQPQPWEPTPPQDDDF